MGTAPWSSSKHHEGVGGIDPESGQRCSSSSAGSQPGTVCLSRRAKNASDTPSAATSRSSPCDSTVSTSLRRGALHGATMFASSGRILGVLGPVGRDIELLVGRQRKTTPTELPLVCGAAGSQSSRQRRNRLGLPRRRSDKYSAASVADGRDCRTWRQSGLLRLVLSQFGAETHSSLRRLAEQKVLLSRASQDGGEVITMLHGHPPYR